MPWYVTALLGGLYGGLLTLYLVERHLAGKLEMYTKVLEQRNVTLQEDVEELKRQLARKG